jgi:DNA-binding response OmpR family regulator
VVRKQGPVNSTNRYSIEKMDEPKTLLVVDDEPMIRSIEAQFLSSEGYKVLQAASAAEALRLAGANASIHLLLTDFSMPEVDGLELVRQFRTVHPETPVLMVSGSLSFMLDRMPALNRFEVLAKPFAFDELLHKVRSLLDTVEALRNA